MPLARSKYYISVCFPQEARSQCNSVHFPWEARKRFDRVSFLMEAWWMMVSTTPGVNETVSDSWYRPRVRAMVSTSCWRPKWVRQCLQWGLWLSLHTASGQDKVRPGFDLDCFYCPQSALWSALGWHQEYGSCSSWCRLPVILEVS